MSVCVLSAVLDADDPDLPIGDACVVHGHWAPCPRNGKPAITIPMHGIDTGGRDAALLRWATKTLRQRPFVLHHGTWADTPDHVVDDVDPCWCDPERFAPVEVA